MKYFRATVLSFMVVLGAIYAFQIYQISAPTPSQAVSKYFAHVTKGSPMEGKPITVVSPKQTSESKNVITVLLRVTGPNPDMSGVGFAVTRKTVFGWHVVGSQTYGTSAHSKDVIVTLDQFEQKPVIYGQVFLDNAARVEAVFEDQSTVTSEIPGGTFALFGSQYQQVLEFRILDASGRVLKQFTQDELLNE